MKGPVFWHESDGYGGAGSCPTFSISVSIPVTRGTDQIRQEWQGVLWESKQRHCVTKASLKEMSTVTGLNLPANPSRELQRALEGWSRSRAMDMSRHSALCRLRLFWMWVMLRPLLSTRGGLGTCTEGTLTQQGPSAACSHLFSPLCSKPEDSQSFLEWEMRGSSAGRLWRLLLLQGPLRAQLPGLCPAPCTSLGAALAPGNPFSQVFSGSWNAVCKEMETPHSPQTGIAACVFLERLGFLYTFHKVGIFLFFFNSWERIQLWNFPWLWRSTSLPSRFQHLTSTKVP